jgi:hypothetical protein
LSEASHVGILTLSLKFGATGRAAAPTLMPKQPISEEKAMPDPISSNVSAPIARGGVALAGVSPNTVVCLVTQ